MKVAGRLSSLFFKSLQVRIVFIIILFLFILTLWLLNNSFSRSEKVLREKTSNLILNNLQQVANQVENTCLDIIKISNIISSDSVILSELALDAEEGREQVTAPKSSIYDFTSRDKKRIMTIESRLDYIKTSIFFNYDADVLLIDSYGVIYSAMDREDEFNFKMKYTGKYYQQMWYRGLDTEKSSLVWVAPFDYEIETARDKCNYISAVRTIKNDYLQRTLGIIMVNIGEEYFRSLMRDGTNGVVTLINEDGGVIFSNADDAAQIEGLFNETFLQTLGPGKGYAFTGEGGKKKMINYYPLNRVGWYLVSIIPYSEVIQEINQLKYRIYTVNIFAYLLLLITAVLFILYLTNPLKELNNKIRRMKIGDYSIGLTSYDDKGSDDVSRIVKSFDYMFMKIEELINVVIEEQRKESELKYEALQAQITPHFLFNTLNTIKWSAMMSGAENVFKMASALGRLLEVSMSKDNDEVTFREEFELVESYMLIQNARYNNNFILNIDADESIYSLKLLKLILQPLVENSIIHGLKNREGKGLIKIGAVREGDVVTVSVNDNGEGIPENDLRKIADGLKCGDGRHKFSGIGLANVNERLKLRYGEEYGVSITSVEGCGTTVTVKLPVIE